MKTDLLQALIGQKINRKKIRIDKDLFDALKSIKQEYHGSLEIYEMAECCFDHFDIQKGNITIEPKEGELDIFEKLQEEKRSSQIWIREDIFKKLESIKEQTGAPIQNIYSLIIRVQVRSLKTTMDNSHL